MWCYGLQVTYCNVLTYGCTITRFNFHGFLLRFLEISDIYQRFLRKIEVGSFCHKLEENSIHESHIYWLVVAAVGDCHYGSAFDQLE
jgi:hypothetical protein